MRYAGSDRTEQNGIELKKGDCSYAECCETAVAGGIVGSARGRLLLESELFLTVLEPKAPGIIRVSVTCGKELSDMPRPGIVPTPAYGAGMQEHFLRSEWEYTESPDEIVLTTGRTVLWIVRETGSFSWYDENGRLLLAETEKDSKVVEKFPKYRMVSARTERVKTADGEKEVVREAERAEDGYSCHAALHIRFQGGEAVYGFGQHEEGYGNLRGRTLYLHQANRKIVVPLMVSNLGYGILMDTYSPLIFSDGESCRRAGEALGGAASASSAYIYSEAVSELDFYFIYGGDMEGVIRGCRYLTGSAALLPKWAFGYIQSQERYETQEEIENVAGGYRQRGIGLDCVVLDWCSWEDGKWGRKTFDAKRFPDPAGMMERLHGRHTHFMISVWANNDPGCENYSEFADAGLFLPGQNIYNALSGAGREMYWKQMKEGLFRYGVDAWWCDNSEPITPEWNHPERPEASRAYDEYVRCVSDHIPAEQANVFGPSLMVCPVHEPMYYLPRSQRIDRERSRRVYLPKTPGGWYDYETGEHFGGGQWICTPAPIGRIPVFVKAGSVIPEADFALSTEEQSGRICVRIYPGADGAYILYEDDGDGYGYEKGEYRLTVLRWDDQNGRLAADITHDYAGGAEKYTIAAQTVAARSEG